MKKLASLVIALALSVVALVGCGGAAPTGAAKTVAVQMLDTFKFEPNTFAANKGDTITVNLTNAGTMPHDFTISSLKVNKTVEPGKTDSVTFTVTKAGTVEWVCTQPGHKDGGMTGTITVK